MVSRFLTRGTDIDHNPDCPNVLMISSSGHQVSSEHTHKVGDTLVSDKGPIFVTYKGALAINETKLPALFSSKKR